MLNQLFSTHIDTQVAMGKLDDFDRTHDLRVADAVSGTLLTIMPLHPPLAVPATLLSMGKGATMPFLHEGTATSASADAARSESVREVDRWYSATLGNMVVTMQDGGGFAGTPAEADSWQSAHGVGEADRFTGPGGRVLEPAAMTEGQRAAYQRWLSDPANEAVRVEMVRIFTALDAAGGQRGG